MTAMDGMGALPPGWMWARLGEVCEVNPLTPLEGLPTNQAVAFVPMAAVEAQTNKVDVSAVRDLAEVSTGFTRFMQEDVLFAKITPCMENGKIAVVPEVPGSVAFGSTEFHVLRSRPGITPAYLQSFLVQQAFRAVARRHMSGAVGQQRVPASFMRDSPIPVPPSAEQARITARIATLFTDLDGAEAALSRARTELETYRASLLHAACTGQLTAAWRAERSPPAEDGPTLLRRILSERRTVWERAEYARLQARGKPPKGSSWKARYQEPVAPDLASMPDLPLGWTWASLDQLSWATSYGTSAKCGSDMTGIPVLRIPNIQTGSINWLNLKYSPEQMELEESSYLAIGDLLIVRTNGSPNLLGRAAVLGVPPIQNSYFASYLIRFRLLQNHTLHRWVGAMFAAPLIRQQVERYAATSAGQYNISQTNLARFALPLPPSEELAKLTDELAAGGLDSSTWPDEPIATLRQSILHAAFTGCLVPQDPADEPAAALLARLRAAPAPPRRSRKQAPAL